MRWRTERRQPRLLWLVAFLVVFATAPVLAQHDALRQAAVGGDSEVVRHLLAAGQDPNAYRHTYSPLMFAARHGHVEVMTLLLAAGADPEHRDHNGDRAMLWAAASGNAEAIRLLLAAGSPPDSAADPYRRSPLLRASRYGGEEAVALLLTAGADPNWRDSGNYAALHEAVLAQDLDVLALLLGHEADPDAATEILAETPLHLAAVRGLDVAAGMLIAAGANTELQDARGRTALWLAASRDDPEILALLIAAGADANAEVDGVTAFAAAAAGLGSAARQLVELTEDLDGGLAAAAWGGHFDLVRRLFARGGDLNARDIHGRPAIAAVALAEGVGTLEWFLANGADLDKGGVAALHEAVDRDRADLVRYLLEAGVPVDARDRHGASALLDAVGSGLVDMVRLLLERGADPYAQDGTGRDAEDFMSARRRGLDHQQLRVERSRALIRMPELDAGRRDLAAAHAEISAMLAASRRDRRQRPRR